MLREAFNTAARIPGVKRMIIRALYQKLTDLDKGSEMLFMNYGFAGLDPDEPDLFLLEEDQADRYSIRLYDHVVGQVDLGGKNVLEVGCGRGGGASYLARYHKPASFTGLDFSEKAIAFCRRQYSAPGLAFSHGDAEALPFPDGNFDAVINVESSHNYPSMAGFVSEAARVLRPGGHFLITDHRDLSAIKTLREQLTRGGFTVLEETDITVNVVEALNRDDERKRKLLDRRVPKALKKGIGEFAALVGTDAYEEFRSRKSLYLSFVCVKDPSISDTVEAYRPSKSFLKIA